MITVPAGSSDERAVADADVTPDGVADARDVDLGANEPLCGDDGLPLGVDSGTGALPQPATSRQSTTATLLTRQVWGR
jgi:hypothetical protein